MTWLVVSVLVAIGFGWVVVSTVWPVSAGETVAGWAIRVLLSVGIGHGVTSCAALLFVLVRGRFSTSLRSYELIVLALVVWVLWKRGRLRPVRPWPVIAAHDGYAKAVALALAVAAAAATGVVVIRYGRLPYGEWDAWAIYNLRARFLYRAAADWRLAFSGDISWSHPDYPLLLPLSVVRGWVYAGGENTLSAGVLGPLFAAATVGLVAAVVARLRGAAMGGVAGLVTLGNVVLLRSATAQMADIPLMFFFAAAIGLLALQETASPDERWRLQALAGVTAALAAWTKNEGALFLLAFGVAHLVTATRSDGWRAARRSLGPLVAGALPVVAVLLWFKVGLAPRGTLATWADAPAVLAKLTDPGRYALIAREFAARALLHRGPGIDLGHALILYAVFAFMTPGRHATWQHGALTLALLWAGYGLVYVTTPFELVWHIWTSMDRLLLQTWPALVLVVMLRGPSADALSSALRRARGGAVA